MSAPVLAFTGSRTGVTLAQRTALRGVLAGYAATGVVLHNGCAEGADEDAAWIAASVGYALELWPCNRARLAWARDFAERHEPVHARVHPVLPPLDRNARMVEAASVLVACPDGPERVGSGTWSTVRAARRLGREVVIVWPDGRVEREVERG